MAKILRLKRGNPNNISDLKTGELFLDSTNDSYTKILSPKVDEAGSAAVRDVKVKYADVADVATTANACSGNAATATTATSANNGFVISTHTKSGTTHTFSGTSQNNIVALLTAYVADFNQGDTITFNGVSGIGVCLPNGTAAPSKTFQSGTSGIMVINKSAKKAYIMNSYAVWAPTT